MQDTGIVRRIDDLGRVVIPKEIRRTLKIREGDPLEIYTNKEELILKKYSPVASIGGGAKAVADELAAVTEKTCVVTDCDAVICVSGGKMKDYIGKNLSEKFTEAVRGKKSLLISRADGGTVIPLVHGDDLSAENQIIVPVTADGDCYGAVMLFDKDKTARFSSHEVKLAMLGAGILAAGCKE